MIYLDKPGGIIPADAATLKERTKLQLINSKRNDDGDDDEVLLMDGKVCDDGIGGDWVMMPVVVEIGGGGEDSRWRLVDVMMVLVVGTYNVFSVVCGGGGDDGDDGK